MLSFDDICNAIVHNSLMIKLGHRDTKKMLIFTGINGHDLVSKPVASLPHVFLPFYSQGFFFFLTPIPIALKQFRRQFIFWILLNINALAKSLSLKINIGC